MMGQGEALRRVPGRWFAGSPCWDKEVQHQMPLRPNRAFVRDATLREGEEILDRP